MTDQKIKYHKPIGIGPKAPSSKLLKNALRQTKSQHEKKLHLEEYINILKAYHTKSKTKKQKYAKKITKYTNILKGITLPKITRKLLSHEEHNKYILDNKNIRNQIQHYELSKLNRDSFIDKYGIRQTKLKTDRKKRYNQLYNAIMKARYDKKKAILESQTHEPTSTL